MNRSYSGLLQYHTFEERFNYLALKGELGHATFGFERWVNQGFYTSREWRRLRDDVIARDEGLDLGVEGKEIYDKIIIHHIVPLTMEHFDNGSSLVTDLDNLITTCHETHNAIHYGDMSSLRQDYVARLPGDTKLW